MANPNLGPGIIVKILGLSLIIIGILMILVMFEFMYYIPWDDGTFQSYLVPCFIVIVTGVIFTVLGYWDMGLEYD